MTPGPNLLFRILAHVVSAALLVGDGLRRVRYRRADLRALQTIEMASEGRPFGEGFGWASVHGRPDAALLCPASSHIIYDVTLPSAATLTSWCALAPGAAAPNNEAIEFEIHVQTKNRVASARRVVWPGSSRFGWRWHALRVRPRESGAARIVLTTRRAGAAATAEVSALWGSPRIESKRSVADLLAAVRPAFSAGSLRSLWYGALPSDEHRLYDAWVRENEPSRRILNAQRRWSAGRARLFSLITFVAEPTGWEQERTAASVRRQTYAGWEWILVATDDSLAELREAAVRIGSGPRVRVIGVPSGASRADAWNAGLAHARGEFAALLCPHDVLAPAALYEMERALERLPDSDLLYSDEDRVSSRGGRRHEPHFKPDWSPDLLVSSNYIGRLALFRVAAVNRAGGFRALSGAEEWDLLLRLSRVSGRIRRVPLCLYHRDEAARPETWDQAERVLQEHCQELGMRVAVTESSGAARIVWNTARRPLVSIVIPNRDAAAVLTQCVSGLLNGTSYPNRELVIVDNGSTDQEVLDLYASVERGGVGRIVPFAQAFNFSAACNAGAAAARGDLLLFLNNDIEVIQRDWLDELVRWAERPDVGVVGAKLLYPDRTIQHAGVVFGLGLVGHIFGRAAEGTGGVFGSSEAYRNYLAVTGACQMMRQDVFRNLGGYDERFRLSFSDVVLCMESWRAGLRVVYTPHARLVHHESYTRKREDSAEDMELLARYLQAIDFAADPYFHPELNPKSPRPAIRPPFDPTPSQVVREYVARVLAAARS